MDWRTYLYPEQPVWNDKILVSYEEKMGIAFPESYKETVAQHQGNIPPKNIIKYFDGRKFNLTSMGPLFHFIENDPQFESYNIYNNFLVYKDRVPEKVIPFSEDPGGFQIAFDFRKTPGDPPVVLVNSDANKPENYLIKIGDNFEAFLQNLLSDEDLEEHGFH